MGGFSVTPVIPEELQHPDMMGGNFDIFVTPGQTVELGIEVHNLRDEPIAVEVTVVTAGTNRNGIIGYSSTGEFGGTLPFLFEDVITMPPGVDVLTIPPLTTATLPFTIEVPAGGFDGLALGAIHVLLGITEEELAEAGMIVNRFAAALPIRMRISEPQMDPEFYLGHARAGILHYRTVFVIDVHHPVPRITRPTYTSTWIYPAGSDSPVFTQEDMPVEYTPHAIFPATLMDEGLGIDPGDYIARVRIEYDGRVWNLEQAFTVHPQSLEEPIHGQARALQEEGQAGLSTAVIIAIAGGGVLLLVLLVLLLKAKNKRADEQIDWSKIPQHSMAGNAPLEDQLKGMDKDELTELLARMQPEKDGDSGDRDGR